MSRPASSRNAPAEGCSSTQRFHSSPASSPVARVAVTGIVSPPTSIAASGFASRLSAQAGSRGTPRFMPATTRSSPRAKQATAVERGSPDLRPHVVSATTGWPPANSHERRKRPPVRRSNNAWNRVTRVLRNRIRIGARVARASGGPTSGRSTSQPSKTPNRRWRLSFSMSFASETGAGSSTTLETLSTRGGLYNNS